MTEAKQNGKDGSVRIDALGKVSGKLQYVYDMKLPNQIYGKLKRSPFPHARIVSIDTEKARQLEGVRAVFTAQDIPIKRFGYGLNDQQFIARDIVRFTGEPIAAVAADTVAIAERALDLIEIEYKELPAIYDPTESMMEHPGVVLHPELKSYERTFVYSMEKYDRPNVAAHYKIRNGSVEDGFSQSNIVVENNYSISRIQHVPLEPHACLVDAKFDGTYTIWTQSQQPYLLLRQLQDVLGIASSKFRIIVPPMGGAFGNKTQMLLEPFAAMLSRIASKPVKIAMTREEVFSASTSRTPIGIHIKDGISKEGKLKARAIELVLDAGAYAGESYIVNRNAAFGAIGSYSIPNFSLDSYCVYTNKLVGGAYRGFGSMELQFAIEQQMDILASKVGMDPLAFREINLLKEGERDAMGEEIDSSGLRSCVRELKEEWTKKGEPGPDSKYPFFRGRSVAIGNKYSLAPTASAAFVKVNTDGTLEVRASAIEVGQGVYTTLAQIAADVFKTSIDKVHVIQCDTSVTPFDFGAISSRSTHVLGTAVKMAAQDARQQVLERAGEKLEVDPSDLDVKDESIFLKADPSAMRLAIDNIFEPMSQLGLFLKDGGEIIGRATRMEKAETPDLDNGRVSKGKAVAYYSYTAQMADLAVDVELGTVKVLNLKAVCDCGSVINPKLLKSQIEGGLMMGLGGCLFEELLLDDGVVTNPDFLNYKVPMIGDLPDSLDAIILPATRDEERDPLLAKGGGEVSLVVTAAAIANAITDATGVRLGRLPLSRERIQQAYSHAARGESEIGSTYSIAGKVKNL